MIFGLLGEKLSHSYSPRLHEILGIKGYRLFEVAPELLEDFLKNEPFDGLNVTTPYKNAVIPYLDSLSDCAKKTGSVNVIIRKKDGTLYGDNQDVAGFQALLKFTKTDVKNKKTLVLGSGGVSGSVRFVLSNMQAGEIVTVSRTGEVNYENVYTLHPDAQIIINATPIGMYPDCDKSPIDVKKFKNLSTVLDLIYNPYETKLLYEAYEMGIKSYCGLYMLAAQAAASKKLFLNKNYSKETVNYAYEKLKNEKKNIVLIGLPGSGKTVMCKRLSALLKRPLVDIDRTICEKTGKTSTEIIEEMGEDYFRKLETETLKEIAKGQGQIISTGGGVVERAENLQILRMNSTIVYLIRKTQELKLKNRPKAISENIESVAVRRIPLYKSWCDIQVLNTGIGTTPKEIIRMLDLKLEPER